MWENFMICIIYSFSTETIRCTAIVMTCAMKNYIWGNTICISHCSMQLTQQIVFRLVQFFALPPKIVLAPVVLFQSTWYSWSYHQPKSSSYRHYLRMISISNHQQLTNVNSSYAVVVVPLRFPHRQNLCNRPPSASEDSTTPHLANCISKLITLALRTLQCQT